jgi:hypothetical protein
MVEENWKRHYIEIEQEHGGENQEGRDVTQ